MNKGGCLSGLVLGDNDVINIGDGVVGFGADVLDVDQERGGSRFDNQTGGYVGHGVCLVVQDGAHVGRCSRVYDKL